MASLELNLMIPNLDLMPDLTVVPTFTRNVILYFLFNIMGLLYPP